MVAVHFVSADFLVAKELAWFGKLQVAKFHMGEEALQAPQRGPIRNREDRNGRWERKS